MGVYYQPSKLEENFTCEHYGSWVKSYARKKSKKTGHCTRQVCDITIELYTIVCKIMCTIAPLYYVLCMYYCAMNYSN